MEITITIASLIPATMGVVEVIKRIGLPKRFLPLLALGVGVAGSMVLAGEATGILAIQGTIVGLMAVGIWSGGKSTIKSVIGN